MPVSELAEDAIAVLDALDVDRAHVVGMSMGGTLYSYCCSIIQTVCSAPRYSPPQRWVPDSQPTRTMTSARALPKPDPKLMQFWQHLTDRPIAATMRTS